MTYNLSDIKTKLVAGYNYCKKIYRGGINTPEQFEVFINLCEAHINNCNYYCAQLKPMFGIFQFKRYTDYCALHNICGDTVAELNEIINGLNIFIQKQKEENEAYAQLETRLKFEAAVAYDIKEAERKQTLKNVCKRPIGFIINTNNTNDNE